MWTIILTRSEEEVASWQVEMPQDVRLRALPVVEYEPVEDVVLPPLEVFTWILLTSARAVKHLLNLVDVNEVKSLKVACVGRKTAAALPKADLVAATGELLAREMLAILTKEDKVLYPGSSQARQELPDALRDRGIDVVQVDLYRPRRQLPRGEILRALEGVDGICFFAPSQVKAVRDLLTDEELTGHGTIYAIGPTTAGALPRGMKVVTLKESTPAGLIRALKGGSHETG